MYPAITGLKRIATQPRTLIVTISVAVLFLAIIALMPNRQLIFSFPESYSLSTKIGIIISLFGSLWTNFTLTSLIAYIAIAILTGLNIAFVFNQVGKRAKMYKESGAGIMGMIAGMLGVGCAACGSVVLSSLIGIGATSQLIGFFPLKGFEFTILSLLLLLGSTYFLARKAGAQTTICKIVTYG